MTEDFRKTAPAPLAPREFNLPTPNEIVLANGLKLVIVEDRRLPIVSFRLLFKTGAATEPRELPGLLSMLTTMLNEGTLTRTSRQIAAEVERLGASLSASAGADSTVVAASALAEYQSEILELMADVVLNPTFPENELHVQRDNAKQSLLAQRAQPAFLADEQVAKALFGEHPYSVVAPTEAALDAMSSEILQLFHRQMFAPNNAVLIVVGDVDTRGLAASAEKLFGAWQPNEIAKTDFPALPELAEKMIYFVDRPASAQSTIVLANQSAKRDSPDFFEILTMNQVLGAGASSRLFMNLREEKDMTYGAYSSFDMRREAGAFEASAEVRSTLTGDALKEFLYEINRIQTEIVPEQELTNAKNYMTGVFPIRLETQEGLIGQLVAMQTYDLPADYLDTYRANIDRVTAEQVKRAAQKYIAPDNMAIVVVGDQAAVLEQIEPYARNIEIFDTNGNKKGRNEMNPQTATENWNLTLSSPQGDLPVTLKINSDGGNISGILSTPFGDGTISGGSYDLKSINTTASLDFQGTQVTARVEGTIDENQINGTVSTGIPGFPPLPFKGTRAASNI